jgi:hypothetical protein
MALIDHHHTDGTRPVLLLAYKHGAKVAKKRLASPKSLNIILQLSENQRRSVNKNYFERRFPKSGAAAR